MKDTQYERLLAKVATQIGRGLTLLSQAEAEYKRRYGAHPSDIDDDSWIDSMTGTCGIPRGLTPVEVDEGATLSGRKSFYL